MSVKITEKIISSYQTHGGGFIVHNAEQLKKIYSACGIDPRSTDPRIFDLESLSHFFQKGVEELFKKLNIKKTDNVLSVGEGNASPSRLLAKLACCQITGVDINLSQIEKAKSCAILHGVENNVKYILQDAAELDLPQKNYDKAYFNETIGHWEKKESAFRNIYNHLKDGAKIGFNLWIRGDKGDLNDAYEEVPTFKNLYKPGIWFQLSLDELIELLMSKGFRLIEKEEVTDKVDLRMQFRLKAIKFANNHPAYKYSQIMGKEAAIIGQKYYEGMLDTHYNYLRYARLIMEKTSND
jgi:ubiquinone/menaquinone biosynthesis C-methylase UbiE